MKFHQLALCAGVLSAALLTACAPTSSTPTQAEAPASAAPQEASMSNSLHSLVVNDIQGKPVELSNYRGKVLLLVNTASKCGLTPQYAGLQALYTEFAPRGVEVLGFPCNDFGGQEPGTESEIAGFCSSKYNVSFPMFSKVVTKSGPDQSPLYTRLAQATGSLPRWNFGKYVIGKDGVPQAYFDSKIAPDDAGLRAALEKALAAQ